MIVTPVLILNFTILHDKDDDAYEHSADVDDDGDHDEDDNDAAADDDDHDADDVRIIALRTLIPRTAVEITMFT